MRYFESTPDSHRSTMYHAILVAYLQWARLLGYKYVHIWVEPPKMGDEYVPTRFHFPIRGCTLLSLSLYS